MFLEYAYAQRGRPYIWGDSNPVPFDCTDLLGGGLLANVNIPMEPNYCLEAEMKYSKVKACVTPGCPNPSREQTIVTGIPVGEGLYQPMTVRCAGCNTEPKMEPVK